MYAYPLRVVAAAAQVELPPPQNQVERMLYPYLVEFVPFPAQITTTEHIDSWDGTYTRWHAGPPQVRVFKNRRGDLAAHICVYYHHLRMAHHQQHQQQQQHT